MLKVEKADYNSWTAAEQRSADRLVYRPVCPCRAPKQLADLFPSKAVGFTSKSDVTEVRQLNKLRKLNMNIRNGSADR